jgi:S1-C subfamily serine protease
MKLVPDDDDLLDAYSRAVIGVVDRAARRPLDRRLAYHHGLGAAAIEVQSVEPGSPAAKTGLVDGDLLVRFGETPLESVDELHKVLRTTEAGKPISLGVIRRGVRAEMTITPTWMA